jgi:hypothetical protein
LIEFVEITKLGLKIDNKKIKEKYGNKNNIEKDKKIIYL